MATPIITSVVPTTGPTSGGDSVRLTGTGFGPRVAVEIGGRCQVVALRREADGTSVLDVRTPAHTEGVVDVLLQNLDQADQPVANENTRFTSAYRFLRPRLAREADLTRLVRTLLRELKRQVIVNVSLATSVDYDDGLNGGQAVALASLPALVVTGPTIREPHLRNQRSRRRCRGHAHRARAAPSPAGVHGGPRVSAHGRVGAHGRAPHPHGRGGDVSEPQPMDRDGA